MVIVYSSAGAGHARASEAIRVALERLDPPIHAEMIDALDFAPAWFRGLYRGGYGWVVSRCRPLYGYLYHLSNRQPRWYQRPLFRIEKRIETFALRSLARHLAGRQPLCLISTHVLFARHVADEFAGQLDRVRQVVVVTDNEAHRFWKTPDAERYFVHSDDVVRDLAALGVPPQRVIVSGIPIHPVWLERCDRQTVLGQWNLPEDRPIVLMIGGANFTVGPFADMVRRLVEADPDVHVVAVTGRNRKVYAKLCRYGQRRFTQRRFSGSQPSLTVIEYTDRLHELMSVASLLVTKPGGLMTSEALAKGVPMILINPIPGQEAANARYLTAHGAALPAGSPDELVRTVGELLSDADRLRRMRSAAQSLAKPGAAAIAEFIQNWSAGREK